MQSHYRLSLVEAIFVNINVMIGMGLFVNTYPLIMHVGLFSFVNYLIVGILLLPLILSMIRLVFVHPEGGFYTYASQELNQSWGFLSSWSYFIGKTASATLILYAVTLIIRDLVPLLSAANPLVLFMLFLAIVIMVNTYGMKFGSFVQKIIVCAKFVPIFIVMGVGIWYFSTESLPAMQFNIYSLLMTIPIVLYATMGFETACVLSLAIENGKKNAPIAIFTSYIIVIFIAALYQFFASAALIAQVSFLHQYQDVFKYIAQFFTSYSLENEIWVLLYGGIAISGLGSAFGIFYSNMWNLYTLAKNNNIPLKKYCTSFNVCGIPAFCLFIEGVISLWLIFISQANIVLLQQCSALAISLTFTISVFSLFKIYRRQNKMPILPVLGLINCFIFVSASLYSLIKTNWYGFILFACLLLFGIVILLVSRGNRKEYISSDFDKKT